MKYFETNFVRKSYRNDNLIITIRFDRDGYGKIYLSNLIKRLKFVYICIKADEILKFCNELPENPEMYEVLKVLPKAIYFVTGLPCDFNHELSFGIINNMIVLPESKPSIPEEKEKIKLEQKEYKNKLRRILY